MTALARPKRRLEPSSDERPEGWACRALSEGAAVCTERRPGDPSRAESVVAADKASFAQEKPGPASVLCTVVVVAVACWARHSWRRQLTRAPQPPKAPAVANGQLVSLTWHQMSGCFLSAVHSLKYGGQLSDRHRRPSNVVQNFRVFRLHDKQDLFLSQFVLVGLVPVMQITA